MQEKPQPHAALTELHEKHRAAGLDPMHTPVIVEGDHEAWPAPFMPVRELEQEAGTPKPTPPAKRRSWPNFS
jgi:hypothetical protein